MGSTIDLTIRELTALQGILEYINQADSLPYKKGYARKWLRSQIRGNQLRKKVKAAVDKHFAQ